jgi:hypothetical protein
LGLRHRVKVLLKTNAAYLAVTGDKDREHFKFDLFTDEEIGITPGIVENRLVPSVSTSRSY